MQMFTICEQIVMEYHEYAIRNNHFRIQYCFCISGKRNSFLVKIYTKFNSKHLY